MTIDLELKIEDALFRIKDLYAKTDGKCCLSFSGGKDSTVVAELIIMAQKKYNLPRIPFVFADTKVEYDAIYEFVDWFSKNKYPVEIVKPSKPFGRVLKEYGLPFASKIKSQFLHSYQNNNSYEYYLNKDASNLEEKLQHRHKSVGELISGNMLKKINKDDEVYYELRPELLDLAKQQNIEIDKNWTLLIKNGKVSSRERLANKHMHVLHPSHEYKIASKCCDYVKKQPFYKYYADNGILGYFTGVRIEEGGVRAIQYKTCTATKVVNGVKMWHKMPIFDWTDDNVNEFIEVFNVKISDVYTVYGLERSGCIGCPFSKQLEKNLEALHKHEPKKYKAVQNWLGKVYLDMEIELPFDKEYMANLEQRKQIINERRYEMLKMFRPEVAYKWKNNNKLGD